MRRAGFTLLEEVVVLSLLVIVMVLTNQVLVPCLQLWQINQAEAALEQGGMIVSREMTKAMAESDESSVTFRTSSPAAVSFLSNGADDPSTAPGYDSQTGKPIWHKFIVYYLDSANLIMYRKEWPNSSSTSQIPALSYSFPTTTAFALSQAELQSVCTTTNGTERRLAYLVASFSGSTSSPYGVQLQLSLTEEVEGIILLINKQLSVTVRN